MRKQLKKRKKLSLALTFPLQIIEKMVLWTDGAGEVRKI